MHVLYGAYELAPQQDRLRLERRSAVDDRARGRSVETFALFWFWF